MPIGIRIVEGLAEQYPLDGLGCGLRGPRAREVLGEGLPYEAPERESPGPGGIGGAPVEIGGEEELCTTHVYEATSSFSRGQGLRYSPVPRARARPHGREATPFDTWGIRGASGID